MGASGGQNILTFSTSFIGEGGVKKWVCLKFHEDVKECSFFG